MVLQCYTLYRLEIMQIYRKPMFTMVSYTSISLVIDFHSTLPLYTSLQLHSSIACFLPDSLLLIQAELKFKTLYHTEKQRFCYLHLPKKFQAHPPKPTEAKPSFRKVSLPPAKLCMLFLTHAPLG